MEVRPREGTRSNGRAVFLVPARRRDDISVGQTIKDGRGGPWKVTGMTLYGPITGERLRSLRVTGTRGPHLDSFSVGQASATRPHTQDELAHLADKKKDFKPENWSRLINWHPRGDEEPPEDFYLRVSQARTSRPLASDWEGRDVRMRVPTCRASLIASRGFGWEW